MSASYTSKIIIKSKKDRGLYYKMMIGLIFLQWLLDVVVAGISLMIGLGIFAFIASILCSVALLQNARDISQRIRSRYFFYFIVLLKSPSGWFFFFALLLYMIMCLIVCQILQARCYVIGSAFGCTPDHDCFDYFELDDSWVPKP